MDNQNKLNQEEMLAAIAEAARRMDKSSTGKRRMPVQPDFNMPIAPAKPDPERDANLAIAESVSGRSPAIQQLIEAKKGNKINPETGMPFYNPEEAPQENPEEAMKRELRMQYLREMATKGQR